MLNVKDAYHQKLLEINGYFTQQILDNDLAEKIKSIYFANFDDKTTTFYSTSFYPDFELKQKVNQEILNIIQPVLDKNFADYKILGSSFLRKLPNQNNPLPLHQDWTVTDEKKYGSYTIWIPLQDTNQTNGAIRVIDRSHQIDISIISNSIAPLGVWTTAVSPTCFPNNPSPMGEFTEIFLALRFASAWATS